MPTRNLTEHRLRKPLVNKHLAKETFELIRRTMVSKDSDEHLNNDKLVEAMGEMEKKFPGIGWAENADILKNNGEGNPSV